MTMFPVLIAGDARERSIRLKKSIGHVVAHFNKGAGYFI
jgi:hypothetical protein